MKEEKLTLRHLSAYLPYGLQMYHPVTVFTGNPPEPSHDEMGTSTLTVDNLAIHLKGYSMPILRSLSDLTKPIEHNGERFTPIERLFNTGMKVIKTFEETKNYCIAYGTDNSPVVFKISKDALSLPYYQIEKLFEWKFNVFNLPDNLWIDVNTLPENCYK